MKRRFGAVALAGLLGLAAMAQAPTGLNTAQVAESGKAHFLDRAVIQTLVEGLPLPPDPGTLAAQADLEAVLQAQGWRSPEQEAFARRIDQGTVFDFADVLGPWFTADRLPALKKFFKQLDGDSGAASKMGKKRFMRQRPCYADARVRPCIEPPPATSSSYPSGHSLVMNLDALVLAEIFPERRDDLLAWGRRAAWSRILAGVHYPSDVVGGRLLAEGLLAALRKSPDFQAKVEKCRAEAAPFLLKKAG